LAKLRTREKLLTARNSASSATPPSPSLSSPDKSSGSVFDRPFAEVANRTPLSSCVNEGSAGGIPSDMRPFESLFRISDIGCPPLGLKAATEERPDARQSRTAV
jgi:hypothetical protein